MDVVNTLLGWLQSGLLKIIDLLPDNPFIFTVPLVVRDILGYLNYFIPIRQMLVILGAWTACILVWYIASVVLRLLQTID